jgi:hypothetical protein
VIDYIHNLVGGRIYTPAKKAPHHLQSYQLYVCRKSHAEKLAALGLGHDKSHTGIWPALREDLEVHMLRGYLDGDGYLSKSIQRVSAVSASKDLMAGYAIAVGRVLGEVPRVRAVRTAIGKAGWNYVVLVNGDTAVKKLLSAVYGVGWGMKTASARKMIDRPTWDHQASGVKADATARRNRTPAEYKELHRVISERGQATKRRSKLCAV